MATHPSVQIRAQQELGNVVGTDRLPTLKDRDQKRLPYIEAIYREVLRWMPPLPMTTPHVAQVEDDWKGWKIPKGVYFCSFHVRFVGLEKVHFHL